MQHILKQLHYVRCPALKLLYTNLCGFLTKNFETAALNDNQGILKQPFVHSTCYTRLFQTNCILFTYAVALRLSLAETDLDSSCKKSSGS